MNRSRFLALGGISLALGLVVSFYVYRDIQSLTGNSGSEPLIAAMVAAKDLDVGTCLQGSDIKMIRVPVKPTPMREPAPKTLEIQLIQGNNQYLTKCQDGWQCSQKIGCGHSCQHG